MKILRQAVGIDVGREELVLCYMTKDEEMAEKVQGQNRFANTDVGIRSLSRWISRVVVAHNLPCVVVLESTGVYGEKVSYALHEQGFHVSIVLPVKARNFARSLSGKSKTDMIDSRMLATMGMERPMRRWSPPSPILYQLRQLTREMSSLKELKTREQNRMHAALDMYHKSMPLVRRIRGCIAFYEKQIKEITQEIEQVLSSDADLMKRVKLCTTIPGVRMMTVVTVVAETNGFALVTNGRQLTSYAGLDVRHNQSGRHVGRTSISKQGNSRIRSALYMPALCASRYNPTLRTHYERLSSTKPAKMVGVIAVARKLLLLIYAIWNSGIAYDPCHGSLLEEKKCESRDELQDLNMDMVAVEESNEVEEAQLPSDDSVGVTVVGSQEPSSVHILLTAPDRDATVQRRQGRVRSRKSGCVKSVELTSSFT